MKSSELEGLEVGARHKIIQGFGASLGETILKDAATGLGHGYQQQSSAGAFVVATGNGAQFEYRRVDDSGKEAHIRW